MSVLENKIWKVACNQCPTSWYQQAGDYACPCPRCGGDDTRLVALEDMSVRGNIFQRAARKTRADCPGFEEKWWHVPTAITITFGTAILCALMWLVMIWASIWILHSWGTLPHAS